LLDRHGDGCPAEEDSSRLTLGRSLEASPKPRPDLWSGGAFFLILFDGLCNRNQLPKSVAEISFIGPAGKTADGAEPCGAASNMRLSAEG